MRLDLMHALFTSFSLSLLLAGCGTLSYDHRESIARATLYSPSGALDDKALSGALLEKFSGANSPPAALASFVESLGGECRSSLTGSLSCSIPQSGGFCTASRIDIEAVVSDGAISSLRAKARHDGC